MKTIKIEAIITDDQKELLKRVFDNTVVAMETGLFTSIDNPEMVKQITKDLISFSLIYDQLIDKVEFNPQSLRKETQRRSNRSTK
jgi:hypothetical protein